MRFIVFALIMSVTHSMINSMCCCYTHKEMNNAQLRRCIEDNALDVFEEYVRQNKSSIDDVLIDTIEHDKQLLLYLIAHDRWALIDCLHNHGVNLERTFTTDSGIVTPLIYALQHDAKNTAQWLIRNRINLKRLSHVAIHSPIYYAIINHQRDLIALLLDAGVTFYLYTPVYMQHESHMILLETALHCCLYANYDDAQSYCGKQSKTQSLSHLPSVRLLTKNRHEAECCKTIELLVERGHDITARGPKEGNTVLDIAHKLNYSKVCSKFSQK